MRTKLLFVLVVFAMSNTLFAQTPFVGDYRSAGPGPAPWNNATSWERYEGPNPLTDWVAATNFPGQAPGSYNVEIQENHVISDPFASLPFTDPNGPKPFGVLTINGTLLININQVVYLSASSIVVPDLLGQIYFNGQGDLRLPSSTSLTVYPASGDYDGGLPDQMKDCNASKRIWFGSVLFSNCNGAGQPIAFQELMEANGSLVGIVNTIYNCTNAVITPSHIGLLPSGITANYQMKVKDPNGLIIYDTTNPIYGTPNPIAYPNTLNHLINFTIEGKYTIELIFNVYYGGNNTTPYVNSRTIDLYSVFTWDGAKWTPFAPGIINRAVIDGNYNTATNGSFSACTLLIKNKVPKPIVVIAPNTYIETQSHIVNDGVLDIANSGSLVQKDNTSTFTGANNTVTRTTRPMIGLDPDDPTQVGTDFVYWGSPTNSNPTIPSSFDSYQSYQWNTTGGVEEGEGAWVPLSNNLPGRGFITGVASTIDEPTELDFTFSGILNSGPPISLPVDVYGNYDPDNTGLFAATGNMVLLGNPYPSAISATSFVTQNAARQIGTLYFWTSVSVFNSNNDWLYNQADYASWNLTGGSTAPLGTSGLLPEGYIASGQGFFAEMYIDGDVVFNNSMRVTGSNDQFFRMANAETSTTTSDALERHRIWLNLSTDNEKISRQMMMGYIEGATNGLDLQYDAKSFTTNEIDLYTVLENKQLAIQGRGLPFDNNDIIPLGYRVTNAGTYAVSISETDGLFTEYGEIYLKDKTTNTFHNLKKGAYEFHAQAGTFNDRFEIHFKESSKESNPIVSENNILIYGAEGALQVNSYGTNIQSIEIFDLVGKKIYATNEVNNDRFVSPNIKGASPFLIARVTLINNQVITKKIIIK